MLLDQRVKIRWGSHSKKHFEELGYIFTKIGEEFEVSLNELTLGTNVKVKYICDYCNGKNQINEEHKWKPYTELLKRRSDDGKDCCNNRECKNKKISESHFKSNTTRMSLLEKFPKIAEEWNYEKNTKNPNQYSYGSNHLVWWICPSGHEYEMTIKKKTREKKRCGCPICSEKTRRKKKSIPQNEVQRRLDAMYGDNEYIILDEFEGSTKKAVIKHSCGHVWKPFINNLLKGEKVCPNCSAMSKGNEKIENFLIINNIKYKREHSFSDCKHKNKLPFDFAVFNNKKLKFLIEYDGKQHFEPVNFGGCSDEEALENFKQTKNNDSIKNKYCYINGIELIRIPYWDFDKIEEILREQLL